MTETAEAVVQLATVDPETALDLADELMRRPRISDRERVTLYRAMSLANRVLGRFEEAIDLASSARAKAAESGDDEQQLLAALTMVGPMMILGRSAEALDLIDSTAGLATTPYLESRVSFQRGAVWALMGQPTRATEAFEAALPAFKEAGDSEMIMSTLRGLGNQRLAVGDLRQAKSDLEDALAMAVSRQEEPIVSGIKHNLGLLASYQGDIPEALELLVDSDQIYMRLTGSSAPQHVARCEVLLSVGLFNEAHRLAKEVAERHRASGDPEHLADALLVAAQGALLAGDLEEALATGEEAARVYAERQRPGHAVGARRIVIEARYGVEGASDSLLEQATEVVLALEAEQQRLAATQARLLAGRIAIDLGDIDQARRWLEPVSKITSGPVEHRIQGRLALAKLRRLHGDRRGADAAARAGLGLIDDYQSALGATDLRMGIERHGADLGSIGFDLALDSGEPRRILRWMERSRARSLRHRPVVAEKDDEIREALGRLRQIDAELRESRGDTQLERERQRLQERVRTADRLKRAGTRSDQTFDIDALIDGLGDRSLLEIAVHDGRLVGVMVSGGRARRAELGESATAMRELAHVRFRMRRVARRGRATGTWSLEPLDRVLLGDIGLDVDEVVLVPPPPLMTTPWAALPRLRDKTLTIAPSAEIWWRAELRASPGEGVVIAGGPDLDTARTEVTEIARLHESAKVFPPGSTVDQVKDAIDGVSLAHIACHATFQSENPMFSSLRLGDGDLNVYDIERLKAPPSTVVLSACDSGYTEAREGVELAGLTSALLSMGSRSVVASVGLVPDAAATADLMIDFHRGLIEGLGPAQALSRAQSAAFEDPERFVAAASFICVGA